MILTEDEAEAAEAGGEPGELGDLGELGEDIGDELGDLGSSTEEQSDDDFLLTPLEEVATEESDSGSQVIALDEDVEFEEAAPGTSGIGAGLLEDDLGEGLGAATLGSEALAPAPMQTTAAGEMAATAAGAPAAGPTVPEATFSGWNVLALSLRRVAAAGRHVHVRPVAKHVELEPALWRQQQPDGHGAKLVRGLKSPQAGEQLIANCESLILR